MHGSASACVLTCELMRASSECESVCDFVCAGKCECMDVDLDLLFVCVFVDVSFHKRPIHSYLCGEDGSSAAQHGAPKSGRI